MTSDSELLLKREKERLQENGSTDGETRPGNWDRHSLSPFRAPDSPGSPMPFLVSTRKKCPLQLRNQKWDSSGMSDNSVFCLSHLVSSSLAEALEFRAELLFLFPPWTLRNKVVVEQESGLEKWAREEQRPRTPFIWPQTAVRVSLQPPLIIMERKHIPGKQCPHSNASESQEKFYCGAQTHSRAEL